MPDDELDDLFAGIDGARPLPSELTDRLHATLAPGAMPLLLRRRIERVLVRRSAQRWLPAAAAAAAVIAVVVGSVAFRATDESPRLQEVSIESTTTTTVAPGAPTAALPSERPPAVPAGGDLAVGASGTEAAAGSAAGSSAAPRPAGSRLPPFATSSDDSPPPSSERQSAAPEGASSSDAGGGAAPTSSTAPPASATSVRIGVIGGDAAEERGFRAYIALANEAGGIDRGRGIELATASATTPAAGSVVTVNLSGQPLVDWKGGPVVETMNATEASFKGEVFGLAGPAERQARIVADLVVPATTPGTTAVIYTGGSGAWAEAVPAAYEDLLRSRGVATVRVAVEPGRPTPLQLADVAFLALDPVHISAFADEVKAAGYAPRLGIVGTWSAFDPTLVGRLPVGSRALSPWQPASGNEANAMQQRAGAPITSSVLHGWAVAKSVAVALARNPEADTAPEVSRALEGLSGYSPLLGPAYEFRKGTRSRTPEGRLFEITAAGFSARGDFRRDQA